MREHGLYEETKAYVGNVVAIKRRLEAADRLLSTGLRRATPEPRLSVTAGGGFRRW